MLLLLGKIPFKATLPQFNSQLSGFITDLDLDINTQTHTVSVLSLFPHKRQETEPHSKLHPNLSFALKSNLFALFVRQTTAQDHKITETNNLSGL